MNKVILSIFLLTCWGALAQGEANNWYFGNKAGITFNTNPPTALTNGQLNTVEGCSSISDINGDLLMYTDGQTIWDRNHEVMPNADYLNGVGLYGDPSSTSSGLIVPHPTEFNLYFVFTVDEPHHENANAYPNQGPADSNGNLIPLYTDTNEGVPEADDGFNNGLNYTLVDMNLRDGLGDVVPSSKSIQLITYDVTSSNDRAFKASEKITAVRGGDCNSTWVISHFKNKYYAFKIDEFGINSDPTVSVVAPNISTDGYRRSALGYMKASPNGDQILTAHLTRTFDRQTTGDELDGVVYLHDFNNNTGVVSNPVELIDNCNPYGVEFSPNGTRAYATLFDGTHNLYQWNLESADIRQSKYKINSNDSPFENSTALQLGPDGKIYHAIINASRLAIIENPNALGPDVDYSQTLGSLSLSGRSVGFGLPPFIQSLFAERINIIDDDQDDIPTEVNLCDVTEFRLEYIAAPGAEFTWIKDRGEPLGETGNFIIVTVPIDEVYPYEVTYQLEVNFNDGECPLIGIAKLTFNESLDFGDPEITTCVESQSEIPTYDLTQLFTNLSQEFSILEEDIEGKFYESREDAQTGTNEISSIFNFENTDGLGSVYCKVISFKACKETIQIELLVEEFPDLLLQDESILLCSEETDGIVLSINDNETVTGLEYSWSTGETSPLININSGGSYFVDVNISGSICSRRKTFVVTESNIASFDYRVESLGNTNAIEILVDPSDLGDYEFAINEPINFQDSNRFENLNPGIYTIFVRDKLGCGVSQKIVSVLGIMEFFTPNGDGINDSWKISGLLGNNQEDILLQVYDRYGKLLASFTNQDLGWDGTYNGQNMPTDDYWYRIKLTDGSTEIGSFTLKR